MSMGDIRLTSPLPQQYHPELDTSPLLADKAIKYFQSQISILRWAVELGRVDIYVDVAMFSTFSPSATWTFGSLVSYL